MRETEEVGVVLSLTMVFKRRHGLIFYPHMEKLEASSAGCGERKRTEDNRELVSLSEGIPLHLSHGNKEERRVCF